MPLVVVYGLKTGDYDWLSQFYPSRRIAQECANRSIPLRFLFPDDVPSFIAELKDTKSPPGNATDIMDTTPADARVTGARNTVVLIRGSVSVGTVKLLEDAGLVCVNTSEAMALANDKLATAKFLESHHWPAPHTFSEKELRPDFLTLHSPSVYSPSAQGFRLPGSPIHWPLVRKPRFGSRGTGVSLVASREELERFDGTEYIFQEYIESSRGRDLRVFFIDGKIVAVVERNAAGDNLVSNSSTGALMRIPDEPLGERWTSMALAIAREAGLWYGTVDFLYLGDAAKEREGDEREGSGLNLTVCEINSAPGFEALEKDCGFNIAGMLIDRLYRRLLLAEKSLFSEQ